MADQDGSEKPGRVELAEDRTHFAEDRIVLAHERSFAGWVRTGMAAVGIGIGFNALFQALHPAWVAKAIATIFLVIAVLSSYRPSGGCVARSAGLRRTSFPRSHRCGSA